MNKMPEPPAVDEKRERFLKRRKLGRYNPNFAPLIPYAYIYGLEVAK